MQEQPGLFLCLAAGRHHWSVFCLSCCIAPHAALALTAPLRFAVGRPPLLANACCTCCARVACRQHPASASAATLPQEALARIQRALDTAGIKMWELSNVRSGRGQIPFRVLPGCHVECFPECWPAHQLASFLSPWCRWITAGVWAPRWTRLSWPWPDGGYACEGCWDDSSAVCQGITAWLI